MAEQQTVCPMGVGRQCRGEDCEWWISRQTLEGTIFVDGNLEGPLVSGGCSMKVMALYMPLLILRVGDISGGLGGIISAATEGRP